MRAHGLGDGTQQLRQIARRAIGDVLVGKVGTPDARVRPISTISRTAGNVSRTSEMMLSALREYSGRGCRGIMQKLQKRLQPSEILT